MKGYIYITGQGVDPGLRGSMNDPLFRRTPTLGACMPNIRRLVQKGDYIFVVSGKTPGVQQYVVGGFEVDKKIGALAAYEQFPENRLHLDDDGVLQGNIIVHSDGRQHPLDRHDPLTFEKRIENYIIGRKPISLETPAEIELGRRQTLEKLSSILQRPRGNRVIDVMARWAKMNDVQVKEMLDWLSGIKAST